MSDDSKRHPPTEHKLEQLREQGKFPFSRTLLLFGVFSGLLLGVKLSLRSNALLDFTQQQFASTQLIPPTEQLQVTAKVTCLLTLALALSVLCMVMIVGWIQNSFYFRWRGAGIEAGRMTRLTENMFQRSGMGFGGAMAGMTVALLVCAAACYLLFGSLPRQLSLSTTTQTLAAAIENAKMSLSELLGYAAAISLFIGLISRMIAGVRFRAAHAMSREELEAEIRELEGNNAKALREG